jgi:hypothetical protein
MPDGGATSAWPPPSGAVSSAIAALRLDLEKYRQKTAEVETLIAKLEAYSNGGASSTPGRRGRRSIQVDDAERRARASAKTREWRERKRAEAEARKKKACAVAARAADDERRPATIAAVTDPVIVMNERSIRAKLATEIYVAMLPELKILELIDAAKVVAVKCSKLKRRRKRLSVLGTGYEMFRQPPSELSEWAVDECGTLCRTRTTSGETPKLIFEGDIADDLEILNSGAAAPREARHDFRPAR